MRAARSPPRGRTYPAGLVRDPHAAALERASPSRCSSGSAIPTCANRPGGRRGRPYDVTAHTLPLLLGVEAVAVAAPFTADLEPVTAATVAPGTVEGDGPVFAIGHKNGDLVALGRLLREGAAVGWAREAFADGGRRFPAGTLLVPASGRPHAGPRRRGAGRRRALDRPGAAARLSARGGRGWGSTSRGCRRWTRAGRASSSRSRPESTTRRSTTRTSGAGGLRERFDAIVLPSQSPSQILNGHVAGEMPDEYTGGAGRGRSRAPCGRSWRRAARSWRSTRPSLFAIERARRSRSRSPSAPAAPRPETSSARARSSR